MIPNPLATALTWRRAVTPSPIWRGGTSIMVVLGVAILVASIAALAPTPAAHAQPGDGERAAPRLLITEMEALKAGAGKLSGAVRKSDFETAGSQLATINRNWPAVRAELQRRGESSIISDFESAIAGVGAAIEAADQDAASADAGRLQQALGSVNRALESADLDIGRLLGAVGLPLLIIVALTALLPTAGRRIGVKL